MDGLASVSPRLPSRQSPTPSTCLAACPHRFGAGIAASLAVNVAQGWSHGLTGAVVAAWPAVSLVGSYELLAWIIRTAAPAGPDRGPAANHGGPQADQPGTSLPAEASAGQRPVPQDQQPRHAGLASEVTGGPLRSVRMAEDQVPGPGWTGPDQAGRADQACGPDWTANHADQERAIPLPGSITSPAVDINAAAVTAYRDSLRAGAPLSERKLAEMFGQTSRRWARNRMSDARQSSVAA